MCIAQFNYDTSLRLELEVQPRAENRDRTAIISKGGIGTKLIIQCATEVLSDFVIVVHFQNLLFGVFQGAVAVQDARTAGGQILLVGVRDAAYDAGQP